jgi:hypothetical protein
MEDGAPGGRGREHAVDDHTVKVQVGVERGAEAVNEGDRAEPCDTAASARPAAGDTSSRRWPRPATPPCRLRAPDESGSAVMVVRRVAPAIRRKDYDKRMATAILAAGSSTAAGNSAR